jgi:hypothetical protein
MKKLSYFFGFLVLFFGAINFADASSLVGREDSGMLPYSSWDRCSSWTLDLKLRGNEDGVYAVWLETVRNNFCSGWSIFSEKDNTIDIRATGPMLWNPAIYETGFELLDSNVYDDLMFTGYTSGDSNPHDTIKSRLEVFRIPEPATIVLVGFGFVVLIKFRRKFRKV